MTTLIVSFCGGVAFAFGAFCALFLVNFSKRVPTKIEEYWENSIAEHRRQIAILDRIASIMEGLRYDEKQRRG